MKTLLWTLAVVVIAGSPVSASDGLISSSVEVKDLDEESTLDDYLAYAALNNPRLQAAFEQWKAAVQRVPQAKALPDPRFTFSYFIEEVETRVGPQRRTLAITQTFPWLGKLKSRGDAAARAADTAEEQYAAAGFDLFNRVKQAYYEYYYLGRAVKTAEENVQLLTYLQEVALTAYASGTGSHGDVIKAQVELGKAEDLLRSLRDKRRPVMARLNAELNRQPDAVLPWPQVIDDDRAIFTDEQLFTWLQESPRLKAADFAAQSRRAQWTLAKKQAIPDLTLGVKVIDTDPARMPGIADSGKDPVVATFSVNLPLWFGKYRAEAKEKNARYQAALHQRSDLENKLKAQVEAALYGFRDARRKIDLYGESLVPKAELHFEVTQRGFTVGKASFLDLIDAQRTLLEFQLAYERARADREQRLAELEMLIGRELPRAGSTDAGEQ